MSYAVRLVLASVLLLSSTKLIAADMAANATRDAMRLVACMKALDAANANSLAYTRVFEEHGITREKLDEAVTNLYQQIRSVHGAFARLDLNASWPPFAARGRTYIFIPYTGLIKSPARNVSTTSFFYRAKQMAALGFLDSDSPCESGLFWLQCNLSRQ